MVLSIVANRRFLCLQNNLRPDTISSLRLAEAPPKPDTSIAQFQR